MIVSIDPTTGNEIDRFNYLAREELDAALSAACTAQAAWRRTSVLDRIKLLRSMAKVLREGRGSYSELITQEMGKPIVEAEAEIDKCAWNCDFYADAAPGFRACLRSVHDYFPPALPTLRLMTSSAYLMPLAL